MTYYNLRFEILGLCGWTLLQDQDSSTALREILLRGQSIMKFIAADPRIWTKHHYCLETFETGNIFINWVWDQLYVLQQVLPCHQQLLSPKFVKQLCNFWVPSFDLDLDFLSEWRPELHSTLQPVPIFVFIVVFVFWQFQAQHDTEHVLFSKKSFTKSNIETSKLFVVKAHNQQIFHGAGSLPLWSLASVRSKPMWGHLRARHVVGQLMFELLWMFFLLLYINIIWWSYKCWLYIFILYNIICSLEFLKRNLYESAGPVDLLPRLRLIQMVSSGCGSSGKRANSIGFSFQDVIMRTHWFHIWYIDTQWYTFFFYVILYICFI